MTHLSIVITLWVSVGRNNFVHLFLPSSTIKKRVIIFLCSFSHIERQLDAQNPFCERHYIHSMLTLLLITLRRKGQGYDCIYTAVSWFSRNAPYSGLNYSFLHSSFFWSEKLHLFFPQTKLPQNTLIILACHLCICTSSPTQQFIINSFAPSYTCYISQTFHFKHINFMALSQLQTIQCLCAYLWPIRGHTLNRTF